MDLNEIRQQIDTVDNEIVALLEEIGRAHV